jgi:long-chain acyl-CoA synthetase
MTNFARAAMEMSLDYDDFELTDRTLCGASAHIAGLLAERGVQAGDHVGVLLPDLPPFPIVLTGILRRGAVAVLGDNAPLVFGWHEFAVGAEDVIVVDPAGFVELVGEADAVTELEPRQGDDVAVIVGGVGLTHSELHAAGEGALRPARLAATAAARAGGAASSA